MRLFDTGCILRAVGELNRRFKNPVQRASRGLNLFVVIQCLLKKNGTVSGVGSQKRLRNNGYLRHVSYFSSHFNCHALDSSSRNVNQVAY